MTTPSLHASPAVRQGVWVGVASGTYGVSFGALAVTSGLSTAQTLAMSLLMFTGGSQFAFIAVAGAGGSGLAAVATAGLLGTRNGVYGLQLVPLMGRMPWWRRLLAAHLTIDESTAVAVAQSEGTEQRRGFWAAGLAVFALWNACTLAGAMLGDALGDPRRWGLDGAAVAAFVALLWPRLRGRDARAVGVLAALTAVLLVPHVPAGVPVLAAGAVALAVALATRPRAPAATGPTGPTGPEVV